MTYCLLVLCFLMTLIALYYRRAYKEADKAYLELWHRNQVTIKALEACHRTLKSNKI